jgi:uncharacterized lipoprotein YajG
MKKTSYLFTTILFALILLAGCSNKQKPEVAVTPEPTPGQLVKRGEYLVTIMGCNDCQESGPTRSTDNS